MNKKFLPFIFAAILTVVTVQSAPPKFENTFETKVFVEGSKAWALCSATDDLPIKYKWIDKQFGDTVTSSNSSDGDLLTVSDSREGSRLIFGRVSKSQAGIYTCTAENQHGLASKLFEIIVNAADDVGGNETLSVEDVHVLTVSDTTVEFLVRASKPVGKYTIRYYEKIDNETVETQSFDNGDQLLLEGLIPSGLYTYQIQVVSSDGKTTSDWTELQEVVLLPYTPEMMLRSLTANTLQIEWSKKLGDFQRETIDGYSISYGNLQRDTYDTWKPLTCMINIELPQSCYASSYTITALYKNSYYEVHLRAHTKAGYGKPAITRVHVA